MLIVVALCPRYLLPFVSALHYGFIRTGFLVLMVALADYLKFVLEIERSGFFWYVGGEHGPLSLYSDCEYRLGSLHAKQNKNAA